MANQVTYREYVQELAKELQYHSNGGTDYRRKTAELALMVAESTLNPYLFWERELVFQELFKRLPGLDTDRYNDVSKMLSVVVRDLHNKKNRTKDVQQYVEMKRKKRKPLAFV